jgi:hypothetical protein
MRKCDKLIEVATTKPKSDLIKLHGEMCYELLKDSFPLDTKKLNQKLIVLEWRNFKKSKKCLGLCSLFGCLLKANNFYLVIKQVSQGRHSIQFVRLQSQKVQTFVANDPMYACLLHKFCVRSCHKMASNMTLYYKW